MNENEKNTEALIARLAGEGAAKPLPHPTKMGMIWLELTIVFFAIVALFHGIRDDFSFMIDDTSYLIEIGSMFLVGVTAGMAAFWLALPDVNQQPWVQKLPYIPLAIFAALIAKGLASPGAETISECLRSPHPMCMLEIVLFSLFPMVTLFALMKRAAPTHRAAAGAMAVLAAASMSYVFLRLIEEADESAHLMIWHFLPVMLLALFGMFAGRIAFRW